MASKPFLGGRFSLIARELMNMAQRLAGIAEMKNV